MPKLAVAGGKKICELPRKPVEIRSGSAQVSPFPTQFIP
jgi:hypothetical protein